MSGTRDHLGPLEQLVGYRFRRTSSLIRKHFEQTVGELGISQVSFGVMSVISANPGIRQGEVARMLDIQRANMVALVGELVNSDIVLRGSDAADRRAVTLTLTAKGRRLLDNAITRIEGQETGMLTGLSQAEVAQLSELLDRVRRNCEERI